MEKARLDKIIAGEGTYSRREVRLLVRQGRVLVDGVPARSPEDKDGAGRQWRLWWTGPCCTAAATPGSCFISLRGSSPPR